MEDFSSHAFKLSIVMIYHPPSNRFPDIFYCAPGLLLLLAFRSSFTGRIVSLAELYLSFLKSLLCFDSSRNEDWSFFFFMLFEIWYFPSITETLSHNF